MLNKKFLFPRRKQHIKVCPLIHFLRSTADSRHACAVTSRPHRGLADERGGKKKETSSRGVRGNRKQRGGKQSWGYCCCYKKKNFGRERSVFYYPVILSSLDQQCSRACGWLDREGFPSVAWTPLKEGRSRRSGRSNGYLIRSLVLFALPDRPPHWNEPHLIVSLLL